MSEDPCVSLDSGRAGDRGPRAPLSRAGPTRDRDHRQRERVYQPSVRCLGECRSRQDQLHADGQPRAKLPHGKLQWHVQQDGCLTLHLSISLADARRTSEAWKADYNRLRPHSSLGNLTPEEFVEVQSQDEKILANTINAVVPE